MRFFTTSLFKMASIVLCKITYTDVVLNHQSTHPTCRFFTTSLFKMAYIVLCKITYTDIVLNHQTPESGRRERSRRFGRRHASHASHDDDDRDDDAGGRSSGGATGDDERDGGGETDECGVAEILLGTYDGDDETTRRRNDADPSLMDGDARISWTGRLTNVRGGWVRPF